MAVPHPYRLHATAGDRLRARLLGCLDGAEILVNDASGWIILQLALGESLLVYGASAGSSVVLALGSLVLAEGMARVIGEQVDDVAYGAIAPLELGAAVELPATST